MSLLEVESLRVELAEFCLCDISLCLEQGEYLTVIGPTGAGKSIFLETLVGFWRPAAGWIRLNGRDITHALPETRRIGIVYQDYALMPHMTVYQNIGFGLKKQKPADLDGAVRKMARSLGIAHLLHRRPRTLSGGEQQRVALARALIVDPSLLLLDEPFSALDRQTRRSARILLKQAVRRHGTTVVHITHDLDDAWAFADKLAVFKGGRIQQFGSLKTVFNRPCSAFVADFVGASLLEGRVLACENGQSRIDLGGIRLDSLDPAPAGARVNVAIRHETVSLQNQPPAHANGYNVLEAVLNHLVPEGPSSLADLSVNGTRLLALVSDGPVQGLSTCRGERLYALIRKKDVRIVTADP